MLSVFENFHQNKLKVYSVLLLVPIILYGKSIFYGFSPMDEQWLIVNAGGFLQKWSSLLSVFNDSIQKMYYRPLFTWSLIIDYHFSGINPFFYHVSNLIYHLIAVLLVYRFLILLQIEKISAFTLTLVFSVHPILLHAVAWVPGRNDILLCIFSLSSLIQLIKYEQSGKILNSGLHMFFFVLALFTKETAVLLPLIFIFLRYTSGRFTRKHLVLFFIWLFAIAVWFWLRSRVCTYIPSNSFDYILTLKKFVLSFFVSLGKIIFPFSQSVTPILDSSWPYIYLGISISFLLLAFKVGLKNKRLGFFGLFMFCVLTVITIWYAVLSPLGEQYEHRSYTPLIGILIFVSQLNVDFSSKRLKLIFTAIIFVFLAKSFIRMDVYKNSLAYLVEGINDCPKNYIFQTQMGDYLYLENKFNAALQSFNTAITYQPDKPHLYYRRANVNAQLNKKEAAVADFTKAIELTHKTKPDLILYRCLTYKKFNDLKNAIADMQYLKQNYPEILPPSLEVELMRAATAKRISDLSTYIQKHPTQAFLYVNRAKLYFEQRMGNEALADLKKACELEPHNEVYKVFYDKLNATFPH